jgi:hypothetical protein
VRLFVLVLAIVLLPLRGWMGNAMAMQMPSGPTHVAMAAPAQQAATQPCSHDAMAHHPSADHADHACTAHAPSDGALQHDGHAPCSQCQLCHSALLCTALPVMPPARPADTQPREPAPRFASA